VSSRRGGTSFQLRLVLVGLLAALCAAPPVLGGSRVTPGPDIPPDDLVEFLLVMDAMENFGEAIDLETGLQTEDDEENARPSQEEGR
jgi:hypothetical protein